MLWAAASPAGTVLTNGPGDGTVTVGVDGYGAFGSTVGSNSSDADYDPIGPSGAAGTTYQSGVAIRVGSSGGRTFLTSGNIGGTGGLTEPAVGGTSTTATSSFVFGGLSFALNQVLTPLFAGPDRTGSLLTQTYVITNTTTDGLNFELVRYIDGDLQFDQAITDGGGRIVSGSQEILFETDTATGSAAEATFVGITADGGTAPATGRYEVNSYSGLRGWIVTGANLGDVVVGDGADADQFIDAGNGYDVTLALLNQFFLGAGATATYTTTTIFGTGAPEDFAAVPEPSTLVAGTLGLGLAGLMHLRRRRRA